MVGEFVDKILMQMTGVIDDEQLVVLKQRMYMVLCDYEVTPKCTEVQVINDEWQTYLNMFLLTKKTQGRSQRTIDQYKWQLKALLIELNKPVADITEDDILLYLTRFQMKKGASNRYIDNKRLCFSSFFTWMHVKGYIRKNPIAAMGSIKYEKKIKKPFTDEELELLRENCNNIKERALIEFLYSTGVRISELISLNISDINFRERKAIVMGKGAKEREVYLTPVAQLALIKYLKTREDDCPALFTAIEPVRIYKTIIREILKGIGERAGVDNVHAHRFRRTLATNLLRKGMPIEEVKAVLGHTKIDTTLIYCSLATDTVKYSHRKYMCG